jgi:hypothetical protein
MHPCIFAPIETPMEQIMSPTPTLKIAVLDRGFVYVGQCLLTETGLTITNARNIRRWGTSAGLGELATKGPQSATKLDATGTVHAPITAVSHLIDCDAAAWESIMARAA